MSRAFVREEDVSSTVELPPLASPLPPGVKNYLTPGGAQRLREEMARLLEQERPRLAALATADDTQKRELQLLDQRVRYLEQSLASAEIVPSPADSVDTVRFGATVKVCENDGSETEYRIVGVDETDLDGNWISWLSPIAKALTNARIGETVVFQAPRGERRMKIVGIAYEP